jgi:DNA-binding CsgD family transcriptional regulator
MAAAFALNDSDSLLAHAWLSAHDRWLAWSGMVVGRVEGQLGWAAYHRTAGDLSQARAHADAALALATEPRQPLALLAAHCALGDLDTATGRYADAAAHLDAALTLADACAAPYERALTLLSLTELRLATGDRLAAAALLSDACTILEPLEAHPALARAATLAAALALEEAPASTSAPSGEYPDGLSAREVEVLRLVAQGLTNAQAAERLYLSPRTVDQHLRSIYNKLGVSSRAAAARWAAEHNLTGKTS